MLEASGISSSFKPFDFSKANIVAGTLSADTPENALGLRAIMGSAFSFWSLVRTFNVLVIAVARPRAAVPSIFSWF